MVRHPGRSRPATSRGETVLLVRQVKRRRTPVVFAGALVMLQRTGASQVVLQPHREGVAVDAAEAARADGGVVVAQPGGNRRGLGEQVFAAHPGGPLMAAVDANVTDRRAGGEIGHQIPDRFAADVAAGLVAGAEAEGVGRDRRPAATHAKRVLVGVVLAVNAVVGDVGAGACHAGAGVADVDANAASLRVPGERARDVPIVGAGT